MTEDLPTGLQLTALDPAFREDPYPILAKLREREPIHRDTVFNRIIFTRHDDVAYILKHPDYWSDPRKGNPGSFSREFLGGNLEEPPSMLLLDDPDHRRLRELARAPFAPSAIRRWRPHVRRVVERIIGRVEEGEFDLIEHVANPIPTVVIAELLGIDPENHERFKAWSDASVAVSFSPVKDPEKVAAADAARDELNQLFRGEIERRRSEPGPDLISAMLAARNAGDQLTEDEIVMQCGLLLLAGNLTTSDLIGNSVRALLSFPDQLAKLRAQPSLMKNAVEEVLRYDSPVTNSGRIAHEDVEIGGEKIFRGESMSVSLASANRDPAIYPDPDLFDIERADTHHHAFGGGRHFCLGAHLARLEAAETLSVLLERFSKLDFGSGGHNYAANPSFRGLTHFSVEGSY